MGKKRFYWEKYSDEKLKRHPKVEEARDLMERGRLSRREFIRVAALVGVSAGAAYSMAGLPSPSFAACETTTSVTLSILGDTDPEGAEQIAVRLFDASGMDGHGGDCHRTARRTRR